MHIGEHLMYGAFILMHSGILYINATGLVET